MKDTAEIALEAYDYFSNGQALPMALGVAQLLTAVDPDECPGDSINQAGWTIAHLLQVVKLEQDADSDARIEAWEAKSQAEREAAVEKKSRREAVRAYFNPDTDDATRAELESLVTDEDIDAELRQLQHQENIWPKMEQLDEGRRELANALKSKRTEPVEA